MNPRPQWFSSRADEPSLWATDIRVPASGIDRLARLWVHPDGAVHRCLWGAFISSEAHFRARVPALPAARWERLTPWELVQYLSVGAGVAQGITDCTPDLPDLARRHKACLYFYAVLVTGFPYAYKAGLGAPTNPEAPEEDAWRRLIPLFGRRVASASRWAVLKALAGAACAAVAPYAAKELQRRAAGRIGYGAAELEFLRRAEHLAPVFGVSGRAIERLTRAAQHRVRGTLRKRGLDEALIQEFLRDVGGQAVMTVAGTWGDMDPLELLARSVAGEMDVASIKIRDDVADAARRPAARAAKEDALTDVFEVELTERAVAPEAEEAVTMRALLERLAANPKRWAWLEEMERTARPGKKRTQTQLAKDSGVDERTIRNRQRSLKDDLSK